MSKMVSARVPDALYEQVSDQLAEIGSNTSDLVNAAFEYVLKERSLPGSENSLRPKNRKLSGKQRSELLNLFKNCNLGVSIPDDVSRDKNIAHNSRIAKYEDIA